MIDPDSKDACAVDTRGLNCPLPVLKAQKAMRTLSTGQRIVVLSSDPKAPADLAQFCEAAGHILVQSEQLPDHSVTVIEKRG
jgi:tRNA 2-thiouridine synthesizing protein A